MATNSKIIIRIRRNSVRYIGVAEAARKLGVTKQAVANYVSGRAPGSLSLAKRSRICLVEETNN